MNSPASTPDCCTDRPAGRGKAGALLRGAAPRRAAGWAALPAPGIHPLLPGALRRRSQGAGRARCCAPTWRSASTSRPACSRRSPRRWTAAYLSGTGFALRFLRATFPFYGLFASAGWLGRRLFGRPSSLDRAIQSLIEDLQRCTPACLYRDDDDDQFSTRPGDQAGGRPAGGLSGAPAPDRRPRPARFAGADRPDAGQPERTRERRIGPTCPTGCISSPICFAAFKRRRSCLKRLSPRNRPPL